MATLSHELRNPLAPLRNGLELMRLQGSRPNPAMQAVMDRQLSHLVRLVDDLLEMSRITRGLLELRRERVELATIVRNAIETSHSPVQEAGHRLDVSLSGEALWFDGDPVRLTQVIGNLLNNSAKYTDHGGTIVLSARRKRDTAVLSVRDNGCGITAASVLRSRFPERRPTIIALPPAGDSGKTGARRWKPASITTSSSLCSSTCSATSCKRSPSEPSNLEVFVEEDEANCARRGVAGAAIRLQPRRPADPGWAPRRPYSLRPTPRRGAPIRANEAPTGSRRR